MALDILGALGFKHSENICIISKCNDPHIGHIVWQQVARPKNPVLSPYPRLMAVQPMYENNTTEGN